MERFRNYMDYNSICHFVCDCYSVFALLYSMEEVLEPQMTVKVVANQWYWSYEYGNLFLSGIVIL